MVARMRCCLIDFFLTKGVIWWLTVWAMLHASRAAQYDVNLFNSKASMHGRANVTLQWLAKGGLINQHYNHLNAMMLAVAVGANHVLWPASRDRFTYMKSGYTNFYEVQPSNFYDMDSIKKTFLDTFGLTVHTVPPKEGVPLSFRGAKAERLKWRFVEVLDTGERSKLGVKTLFSWADLRTVAEQLSEQIGRMIEGHPGNPSVMVSMDTAFGMLAGADDGIAIPVKRGISWAPPLQALADKVVKGIEAKFGPGFSGAHLRLEADAGGWHGHVGGREQYFELYKATMRSAGFAAGRPLYVATGLVGTATQSVQGLQDVITIFGELTCSGLASQVIFKDMYLSEDERKGLGNEQAGIIDLLVLRAAGQVVGVNISSFSWWVQDQRTLDGQPEDSTKLVLIPDKGNGAAWPEGMHTTPEAVALFDARP